MIISVGVSDSYWEVFRKAAFFKTEAYVILWHI